MVVVVEGGGGGVEGGGLAEGPDTVVSIKYFSSYCLIFPIFPSLACRCAKLARSKGYVHFGLQYYGECYGGHESTRRYDHYGRSSKCTGQNYQPCNDDSSTECVGKGFTNYVYHVDQGTNTQSTDNF